MAPKKGKFATLTAWSYSVYGQYLKCPLSVCFDKIQKIRIYEPDNPALMKGAKAHEIADAFISGVGKAPSLKCTIPAPPEPFGAEIKIDLTPIKDILTKFKKAKARTEQDWAFTRQWTPTGWFDRDVWVRIKTDACADTKPPLPPTVDIVDWKTGKQYPEHAQQRSLYALGGLQLVQIGVLAGGAKDTKLTAQHIYVDTGVTATEQFTMPHLAKLKREWEARTKEMLADTTFPAKPGFHCKWCRFSKEKGGPCQAG
jgi:hypothetical protein